MNNIRTRYQRMSLAMRLADLVKDHPDPEVRRICRLIKVVIAAPMPKVQGVLMAECQQVGVIRDLINEVGAEKARI